METSAGSQKWIQPTMRGDIPGALCRHTLTAVPGAPTTKQMILMGGSNNNGRTNKEISILHTGRHQPPYLTSAPSQLQAPKVSFL